MVSEKKKILSKKAGLFFQDGRRPYASTFVVHPTSFTLHPSPFTSHPASFTLKNILLSKTWSKNMSELANNVFNHMFTCFSCARLNVALLLNNCDRDEFLKTCSCWKIYFQRSFSTLTVLFNQLSSQLWNTYRGK